jgi:long-chain acyl-CoA synthetase
VPDRSEAGDLGNLADLVRRAAGRDPEHPALLWQDARLSWGELDERVDRAAAGFLSLGLHPGDRVVLHLSNTPDFVVAYFGILRAGLVAVPANTGFTDRELQHLLTDSGARAAVTADPGAPLAISLREAVPTLEHVVVADGTAPGSLAALLAGATPPSRGSGGVGGEDLAVLLYTSGTTGAPRGAMLSHRALLANIDQVARIEPPVLTPGDVVLLVLPLFHIYGLNTGLGVVARHGATAVLVDRFDPHETLELMARHDVTGVLGAPPMYVAWSLADPEELARGFGPVRLALSGAAPLPVEAAKRLLEATGRPVFEGYGLTETGPVLTSTLMSEVPKPDSIGRAIPGVELRLTDEDDSVPEGAWDPGELVVRGPNLFSGYWPDGAGGPDDEGWFATGDVAYPDVDGDLHLVARRRELILVSGFNVYPREVEDVLRTHPGVADVAVVGIPHPYTGETVKAFIVPAAGAQLSSESVIAHAERSLARFKCPTAVEVVAELPQSATGKVPRRRLRGGADSG